MTEQNTVSSLPLFDVERRKDDVAAPQTVKTEDVVFCTRIQNAPKEPKAGTQCDRVLEYLQLHGSITDEQSRRDLGIPQVARRIFDLKKLYGILTDKTMIDVVNRHGETCRVARYTLRRTP